MLGALIEQLDRPELAASVLGTLDPQVALAIEARAKSASMTTPDFVAGAVRTFIDTAGDDLWFQLLTVMRKAGDPGLAAVQTILGWVVAHHES